MLLYLLAIAEMHWNC